MILNIKSVIYPSLWNFLLVGKYPLCSVLYDWQGTSDYFAVRIGTVRLSVLKTNGGFVMINDSFTFFIVRTVYEKRGFRCKFSLWQSTSIPLTGPLPRVVVLFGDENFGNCCCWPVVSLCPIQFLKMHLGTKMESPTLEITIRLSLEHVTELIVLGEWMTSFAVDKNFVLGNKT